MSNLNLPTNNDHLVSPFPSLECIWEEHGKLLDKLEDIENIGKGDKENLVASGLINDIEQFMKRVRETGRFFDDRKNNQERPSSQSLLDYWSTVLYRYNCQPTDKTLKNFEKSKLVDLSKQGDNFYRGLDETEELKNLADSILLQLVHLEAGNKVVRTPKHRQDLYNLGVQSTDVDRVLEGLVKSQVIYQNTASDNTEKTEFGLAYEGLAYYWKYLKDLLQEKQEKTKERQQLTETAKQWEVSDKKNEFLWRGELLRKAAEYQDLDSSENEFIRQSQKIENKTLVTQKKWLWCGLIFAIGLAIFAGCKWYIAVEKTKIAETARNQAKAAEQQAEADLQKERTANKQAQKSQSKLKELYNILPEKKNLEIARNNEKKGFDALLTGNLSEAKKNFGLAYNAFPTYHNVAEINKLLAEEVKNYERGSEAERNQQLSRIFGQILTNYSWGMPPDIRQKMIVQFLSNYQIGIYYNQANLTSGQEANKIKTALIQYGLPEQTDCSSKARGVCSPQNKDALWFEGRFAFTNTIRYDEKTEYEVAYVLQQLLAGIHPQTKFRLQTVTTPTPNYISIFLL
jgi:hypothetical protein